MEGRYHRSEAEKGPMVLERISDLKDASRVLGQFKDIRGYTVINPKGDEVGKVDDLYIDPKQGQIAMASITFGGMWGFGARRVLIPIDQIEMIDDNFVRVITTPEIIKGAPEFSSEEGADLLKYHEYWCKTLDDMKKSA